MNALQLDQIIAYYISIRSDYHLLHFNEIRLLPITFQLDQIIIIKWKN